MRLVFFGTGSFCLPSLEALSKNVVLVVTQPDRPSGRGLRPQPSQAKLLANRLGLPCVTPERSRALEFVEQLEELKADALVVASYGQILSQRVLDSARRGGINLHGSILPRYRGAAPIQRCIANGDVETGVTLMQMDKGMDTGDVIEVARTGIEPDETYGQLQARLALIAADLAKLWLPKIVAGDYQRFPQDDSLATIAPKIEKAEAELRLRGAVAKEYNRFRAFSPSPGCFAKTAQGVLKLINVKTLEGFADSTPGLIVSTSSGLGVAFSGGALNFLEVQPEGKKKMSGRDFANGARLRVGSTLLAG